MSRHEQASIFKAEDEARRFAAKLEAKGYRQVPDRLPLDPGHFQIWHDADPIDPVWVRGRWRVKWMD